MSKSFFPNVAPKKISSQNINKQQLGNQQSFISVIAPNRCIKNNIIKSFEVNNVQDLIKDNDYQKNLNFDEIDILDIDREIQKKLYSKISSISELQKDLSKLLWIITNSDDSLDKVRAKTSVNILKKRIKDFEGGYVCAFYLNKTSHLLERYREIKKKINSSVFGVKNNNYDRRILRERDDIILEYIIIARDYIDIKNYIQKPKESYRCKHCDSTNGKFDEDEMIFICLEKNCGIIEYILDDTPTFSDSERVNMASRFKYSSRQHFIDAMNNFECKQNKTISAKVLDLMREEMSYYGITPETLTLDNLYLILTEKRMHTHYEDIYLIFHLLTNKPPKDISKYRNILLELHDQLESVNDEVEDPERTNSRNVYFKLYKLLQIVGVPCRKHDFFMLKTEAISIDHEEYWERKIEVLKVKYPNMNPKWRLIPSI